MMSSVAAKLSQSQLAEGVPYYWDAAAAAEVNSSPAPLFKTLRPFPVPPMYPAGQ